jgi:hypothetical protein
MDTMKRRNPESNSASVDIITEQYVNFYKPGKDKRKGQNDVAKHDFIAKKYQALT